MATNKELLILTGSLIQRALFKEIQATNYKILMENYVQKSNPPSPLEIFTHPTFQGKPPFNPEIFQTSPF